MSVLAMKFRRSSISPYLLQIALLLSAIVFCMANAEHLSKLKRDLAEWNDWRLNDVQTVDLRGSDLSYSLLSGANLRGADLRDANLTRAYLSQVDLRRADLRGADLTGADLSCASLSGADLRHVNAPFAYLLEADLRGSDLRYANLGEAILIRSNIADSDLSGALIKGANFSGASYSRGTIWPAGSEAFMRAATLVEHDFDILFSPRLSPEQIKIALSALADFYRSCGGVGFKFDFELRLVTAGDYVKR